MNELKKKLINLIVEDFQESEFESFPIYNGAGGLVEELTLEDVKSKIENCQTMSELNKLIRHEWMYSDVYESIEEMIEQVKAV